MRAPLADVAVSQVYILAQTGDRAAALKLLIEKIGSVAAAIEFIQTHDANDMELWEYLLSESLKSADRVSELLQHVGGVEQVDPIKVIRRIPEGMHIPHLRDRLVKIISDSGLSQSLREGCSTILKSDCVKLQTRLVAASSLGVRVDSSVHCSKCRLPVVVDSGVRKAAGDSLIVFHCSHVFHAQCLLPLREEGVGDDAAIHNALSHESLRRQTDFMCSICFKTRVKQ